MFEYAPDKRTSASVADPAQRSGDTLTGAGRDLRPGATTYASQMAALAPVQAQGGTLQGAEVHAAAARGISGSGSALPHLDRIQASFGRHDLTGVQAHTGGAAAGACREIGASAYAMGPHAVFSSAPSLHTAAHEAAHVVQQRAGVQLQGGVGKIGDVYERHADEVADAVVQGRSAEAILDRMAGPAKASAGSSQAVQGFMMGPIGATQIYQMLPAETKLRGALARLEELRTSAAGAWPKQQEAGRTHARKLIDALRQGQERYFAFADRVEDAHWQAFAASYGDALKDHLASSAMGIAGGGVGFVFGAGLNVYRAHDTKAASEDAAETVDLLRKGRAVSSEALWELIAQEGSLVSQLKGLDGEYAQLLVGEDSTRGLQAADLEALLEVVEGGGELDPKQLQRELDQVTTITETWEGLTARLVPLIDGLEAAEKASHQAMKDVVEDFKTLYFKYKTGGRLRFEGELVRPGGAAGKLSLRSLNPTYYVGDQMAVGGLHGLLGELWGEHRLARLVWFGFDMHTSLFCDAPNAWPWNVVRYRASACSVETDDGTGKAINDAHKGLNHLAEGIYVGEGAAAMLAEHIWRKIEQQPLSTLQGGDVTIY